MFLTVSTAFPNNGRYRVSDISEIESCSDVYYVEPSVEEFRAYFETEYKNDGYLNVYHLFNGILESDKFHFIFEDDEVFTPSTFIHMYSVVCTGCKIEDVINELNGFYGAGEKAKAMMKEILTAGIKD